VDVVLADRKQLKTEIDYTYLLKIGEESTFWGITTKNTDFFYIIYISIASLEDENIVA